MAKITQPLLSAEASGSIGPRLTYSKKATGQQVRIQKAQADVVTAGRTTQREYFIEAYGKWNSLTNEQQQQWNDFINPS